MKLRFSVLAAFVLLLVSLTPTILQGQAAGEVTRTVSDATGAVVPGATVTATSIVTGVSQNTVSMAAGTYTLARLAVGTYNVSAEAEGLDEETASGVTVDVNRQREVDFTLALAGVQATVEVTAAPSLLNTTNATLAGLVSASAPFRNVMISPRAAQPGTRGSTTSSSHQDENRWK